MTKEREDDFLTQMGNQGLLAWRFSIGMLRRLGTWHVMLWNRSCTLAADVWQATKREGRETGEAVRILSKMVQGDPVTEVEKKFFVEQSKDLARLIPLVAISGIPTPIPFAALLILLGKKYGFQVLPGDQKELVEQIKQLKTLDPADAESTDTPAALPPSPQ